MKKVHFGKSVPPPLPVDIQIQFQSKLFETARQVTSSLSHCTTGTGPGQIKINWGEIVNLVSDEGGQFHSLKFEEFWNLKKSKYSESLVLLRTLRVLVSRILSHVD